MKTLKEVWVSKGMTEEDVAVKADVSVRTVSRINKGEKVQTRMLRRVCTALGLSVEEYNKMYGKLEASNPTTEGETSVE